jgi:hypothetical protein
MEEETTGGLHASAVGVPGTPGYSVHVNGRNGDPDRLLRTSSLEKRAMWHVC